MYRSSIGAGFAVLVLAVACSSSGGVANDGHKIDGSAGSAGSGGGSGGTVQSDASAGSGGQAAAGGSSGSSGSGGSGASGGTDSGVPIDLCSAPAGNLIAHGTFEEGMNGSNGLAPTNWEVRNPSMPGTCGSSGTPAQHVYLSPGPPGCGGHALTIDALNQWDCYAIQRVSDYNTIQGGATYLISASVRAQGNAVNPAAWFVLGAQWLDAQDQFFGDIKNPKTASAAANDYDWKVLSFEVVAPSNATRILVWLSAHYPGRVDYDNISVIKL